MAETDLSYWLTTADAQVQIGCSKRTIERLAAAKKLEQRYRPQKGSPDVAVFSPESVAEVAQARRRTPAPFVVGTGQASVDLLAGNGHGRAGLPALRNPEGSYSGDDLIRGLALLISKALQSPPSPPVAESLTETKRFLTIQEASLVTGLTQAYLRRQVEAGTLKAIWDRGWRIRRTDLESL